MAGELPVTNEIGEHISGPFVIDKMIASSAAVTFWGRRRLKVFAAKGNN